ncbi:MAG: xanthine dehydrogenase small subunit, partial [Vibrio sp.]
TLRVEDYFLDYKKTALESGEFIEKIVIPKLGQQLTPEQSEVFNAYKVSKRIDDDISAVCGAFYLKLDGKTVQEARLGFGGMAAIAKRAQHAEAALVGQVFDLETVTKAMTAMDLDFNPLSDFRASASYRMQVAQNLLKRLYLEHKNKAEANPISLQVTHHV